MPPSRRTRRRIDRARSKRSERQHALTAAQRIGLLVLGVAMVLAGAVLLGAGGSGNAARLGRIAGILILLGLVAAGAAAIGHL